MTKDNSNEAITQARAIVLEWVCRFKPGDYPANEELVQSFRSLLPSDLELELRITRNPSALLYEARWYHQDREVADFPKPFCAETEVDAQVLACAAMIALPD